MAPNDAIVSMPENGSGYQPDLEKRDATVQVTRVGSEDKVTPKQHGRWRRSAGPATADGKTPAQPLGYDGEVDTLNSAGKVYARVRTTNIFIRYFLYWLPVAAVLAIPTALFGTVFSQTKANGVRLFGLFIYVQIVWGILWLIKLGVHILPYIFQSVIGVVSSGTRKWRVVLQELETFISLFLWTIVNYALVQVIGYFQEPRVIQLKPWMKILHTVWLGTMVMTGLFLIEKTAIQLLSVSYHRRRMSARIKSCKDKVRMLDLLYDVSRSRFPTYCAEFAKEDHLIIYNIDHDSSTARALSGLARFGDNVGSHFSSLASDLTGSRVDPTSAHAIVDKALDARDRTEALASRLWMSMVEDGSDALERKDLLAVLGTGREEQANDFFDLLDVDANGDVSLPEMISVVVGIAHERKAIARGAADVRYAVQILDNLLMFVAVLFSAASYGMLFSPTFASYLGKFATTFGGFAFMIKDPVGELVKCCLFVFIKHPYDVDDVVVISGTQMLVIHVSLYHTVFKRLDNGRVVDVSNVQNSGVWIENITRSRAMKEQVVISINSDSSFDDVELFRKEIENFVTAPDNKRDFFPQVEIELTGNIGDLKGMELSLTVTHKSNWADDALRHTRRNKLMQAIYTAIRAVPIYGAGGGGASLGDLSKASYSVTISHEEAEAAKAKFKADKEAKRMVQKEAVPEESKKDV